MQHRGASLLLEESDSMLLPVVLVSADPDEGLLVDISAVREVAARLSQGEQFRLMGQREGKLERSPLLQASDCFQAEGVMYCQIPYPTSFEILLRRQSFRAELRMGMSCDVLVSGGEEYGEWDGKLRNLSMTGCLVELPLGAATMLASVEGNYGLELCFPNATRFAVKARLCHEQSDMETRMIRAGFAFVEPSARQDRDLWYFVREIEREGASHAAADGREFAPSPLFVADSTARTVNPRRKGEEFPTAMARNLSFIAEFLDTQVLTLRSGGMIDGAQLSRQSERLLVLLDDAREDLLFATNCLWHEAPVIRHCLGVAIKLVDIAGGNMPRELRKVVMASAMIHDMGKMLLPPPLLLSPDFDVEDTLSLQGHVEALRPRLKECNWLGDEVAEPLIFQINERLDGSGYPRGEKGEALHQLQRVAAVVDVVDAMSRSRADRQGLAIPFIYSHLQSIPMQLDPHWVKRYRQHFGEVPVGSLVRYEGGELAWVQKLDDQAQPAQVQLTSQIGSPRASLLGDKLEGKAMKMLGKIKEVLPVEY